jgi:hypothetical protein
MHQCWDRWAYRVYYHIDGNCEQSNAYNRFLWYYILLRVTGRQNIAEADTEITILEKVPNWQWQSTPKFHGWRVLRMPYRQVVSHAFSKSKKTATRCWRRRNEHCIWCYRLPTGNNISGHSVCLWQAHVERQNSWNYVRTDSEQCITCSNRTRLQEFNIAIDFVVLCVKGFMCSS